MNRAQTKWCARAAAILLLFLSADCAWSAGVAVGVEESPREWGTPVNGFALSITTEHAKKAPSASIVIEIHRKNAGEEKVSYPMYSPETENWRFNVTLPDGTDAPHTVRWNRIAHLQTAVPRIAVLKPGEERVDKIKLTEIFDFTANGKYSISVEKEVFKDSDNWNGAIGIAVSNKLSLTVDQPASRTRDDSTQPGK